MMQHEIKVSNRGEEELIALPVSMTDEVLLSLNGEDVKEINTQEGVSSHSLLGIITFTRKHLQQACVEVDGFKFDMDSDSERYITRTIEQWDETLHPTITWTMADNTDVEVTKPQLIDLWGRACRAQFERGIAIHYRSRELKQIADKLKRSDIAINSDFWDITRTLEDIMQSQ